MSTKKSGNVSIANVLSVLGLAGIGLATFIGVFIHSEDGTPGNAILVAIAFLIGLVLLLFLSIKAKQAVDNPDKWRYVEWGCLFLYIVLAGVMCQPFQRFFYVLAEKESMQEMARNEISTLEKMYKDYNTQQSDYLTIAVQQIKNYKASKQSQVYKSDRLNAYVKSIGDNVDAWAEKASQITEIKPDKELKLLSADVKKWNILELSVLATKLAKKDEQVKKDIEKKIEHYGEKNNLIPVIKGGNNLPYRLTGKASFELGDTPMPEFADALHSANGHTIVGWVVYVILHLLVLLSYVVAIRSHFVGPSRGGVKGGISL